MSAAPPEPPSGSSAAALADEPIVAARVRRWPLWVGLALVVLAPLGTWAIWKATRPRPDPARELVARRLPDWVVARATHGQPAGGEATRTLLDGAARWPAVRERLAALDAAWPDDAKVRAEAALLNRALRDGGLRFWIDVQGIRGQPILLSYAIEEEIPWATAEKRVEALRVRRLDTLNIEMGLLGETEDTPVVFLDRLESDLTHDLPMLLGGKVDTEVDRRAMAQQRRLLEARVGAAAFARAVDLLGKRDALVDQMRKRLGNDGLKLARPETLAFGDEWFDRLMRNTEKGDGKPLLLASDVRAARAADEALRAPEVAAVFAGAIRVLGEGVEAHEVRHALGPKTLPVPRALLDELNGDDPEFAAMAERELRAYLGELHDTTGAPCLSASLMVRAVHRPRLRLTPHYFARRVILDQLLGDEVLGAPELVDRLCALPDEELRRLAAAAWQRLYGVALDGARPLAEGKR